MSDLPGPDVLRDLEGSFADREPLRLQRAHANVARLALRVGLSEEDLAAIRRGLLHYHLAYVEPLEDLAPSDSSRSWSRMQFQLAALLTWRMLNTLSDGDALLRSVQRQCDLARAGLTVARIEAEALGVNWTGSNVRRFHAFNAPAAMPALAIDAPPSVLLERFVEEHFELEIRDRASFMLFLPDLLPEYSDEARSFYAYYVALTTLDDDLDDILADTLGRRATAMTRYYKRLGVLGPGRSSDFVRHHAVMARYVRDQLDETSSWAGRLSGAASAHLHELAKRLAHK